VVFQKVLSELDTAKAGEGVMDELLQHRLHLRRGPKGDEPRWEFGRPGQELRAHLHDTTGHRPAGDIPVDERCAFFRDFELAEFGLGHGLSQRGFADGIVAQQRPHRLLQQALDPPRDDRWQIEPVLIPFPAMLLVRATLLHPFRDRFRRDAEAFRHSVPVHSCPTIHWKNTTHTFPPIPRE